MAKQDPKLEQKTNNLTPAKIHATTQTSTKSLRKSDPDSQNPTPDTDQSSASSNFLGAVLALSFTLIIALTMIVPNLIFLWRRRANSKDSGFFRKKENQSGDSGTDHSDKKKRTLRSPNQNHTTPPASKNCRQPKRQLSKHGLIPNAVTLEDLLKYLFWLGIYSLLCGIIAVIIGYRPFEAVWLVPDSNSNSERLVYSEILSDAIQRDSVQVVKWGPHGYLNNDPSYELIRVVYYSKDSSDNKVRSDVFYSIKDGKIQFRGNNPWGDSWIKKTRPIPAPDQS